MGDETTDHGRDMCRGAGDISPFIWPLGKSVVPDEMNTSFGPRIDADRWDFHDGIDLPAPVGTPVHAMADGVVHRAGPADKTGTGQGFGSTHVLLQVRDPTDGQNDLFLVYLHLNSLEEGVIAGAPVQQGDVIGAVGQEDATYPHLHLEFRKGAPNEDSSVHPLRYLQYPTPRILRSSAWIAATSHASMTTTGGRSGFVSRSRTGGRATYRASMLN